MNKCVYVSMVTTSGEYQGHAYAYNKVVFVDEKGVPFIEKVKPDMLHDLVAGKEYTLMYNKFGKLVDITTK